MFDRTTEPDRSRECGNREPARPGDSPHLEYDRHREGETRSPVERVGRGLADVGIYGCVSFRDLAVTHFGDDPHAARRAVNTWIREGLMRETRTEAAKGRPLDLLTLTRSGAVAARDLATRQGLDPGQQLGAGRIPHGQIAHDAAIYRACRHVRRRLPERAGVVRRIRLDSELRSRITSRSESARWRGGRRPSSNS